MKIKIEGTAEELEAKRFTLLKSVAGSQYTVSLTPVAKKPYYKAQAEMLEYWDKKYDDMVKAIMKEIDEVL